MDMKSEYRRGINQQETAKICINQKIAFSVWFAWFAHLVDIMTLSSGT